MKLQLLGCQNVFHFLCRVGVCLLLVTAMSGMATDVEWKNSSSGVFSTGINWTGDAVPGTTDTVVFNTAATSPYTVTLSESVTNEALRVGSDRLILDVNGNNYTFLNTSAKQNLALTDGDVVFLIITNSATTAVTNILKSAGTLQLGYDDSDKLSHGCVDLTISGSNVNVIQGDASVDRVRVGTGSVFRVSHGARFDSTLCGNLELFGGTCVAEGAGTRLLAKFQNVYAGGVEVITNQAMLVSTNGGITSIHSGGRVTFADGARYCMNEDGTGSGGRCDALNGMLEILSGSSCDFGFRVQLGTELSTFGTLVVEGTDSVLKVATSATQSFQGVFIGGINNVGSKGTGTVTVANGGLIKGEVNIFPQGILQGNGTVNVGKGGFSNGGTVKPGWPVTGVLTVTGGDFAMNYSNETSHVKHIGAIEFELGGTEAGEFDQLVVAGKMTLGGTCTIGLVEGYKPEFKTTWKILDCTTLEGTFDTVNLGDGEWDTSDLTITGEVTFIPPPQVTLIAVR